jgi:hypothetical protein
MATELGFNESCDQNIGDWRVCSRRWKVKMVITIGRKVMTFKACSIHAQKFIDWNGTNNVKIIEIRE